MPTIQAQIWKGLAFNIERLQGKAPGTVIFRFSGPFTARDMFGSLTPVAVRNIFECESIPGDAPLITMNIFDLTGVPYMDSAGLGMLVSQYVRCHGKGVQMIAAGASPRVLQLFKMTKVDTFIPLAATVEEAEVQ
jgi:ABC-type transporter Mla MlaB component